MVNHTKPSPEPWHANGFFVMDADGLIVAEVLSENPQDVHVMSATPELLAAVRFAYESLLRLSIHERITRQAELVACRGAIAKATGKSDQEVQDFFTTEAWS